jgi:hypothetical protein
MGRAKESNQFNSFENLKSMPRRSIWILFAILALATALRFFQLDAQSFWNDKDTSARAAVQDVVQLK